MVYMYKYHSLWAIKDTALYIDYKQVFLNKIYEIRKDRVISEYR